MSKQLVVGLILGACVVAGWLSGFLIAPMDGAQGQVYRIIYLHVPSAFNAFFSAFALLGFSIWALKSKSESALTWSKSCAEVGLILTALCLATGSIWGRPTWNTWWTWDARLTTTLLLAILYCGFLLLYATMQPGTSRIKSCAVLSILIAVDVPVIYKSVTWWRTLHQPTDIIDNRGANMDSTMLSVLLLNVIFLGLYSFWMIYFRQSVLNQRSALEAESLASMNK